MLNCLVTQVVVDRPVCVLARARQRVTASVAEQVDVDREADLLPAASLKRYRVRHRIRAHGPRNPKVVQSPS